MGDDLTTRLRDAEENVYTDSDLLAEAADRLDALEARLAEATHLLLNANAASDVVVRPSAREWITRRDAWLAAAREQGDTPAEPTAFCTHCDGYGVVQNHDTGRAETCSRCNGVTADRPARGPHPTPSAPVLPEPDGLELPADAVTEWSWWVGLNNECHVGITYTPGDGTFRPLLVVATFPPFPVDHGVDQNEAMATVARDALAADERWTHPDGLRSWLIAHGFPSFPWPAASSPGVEAEPERASDVPVPTPADEGDA